MLAWTALLAVSQFWSFPSVRSRMILWAGLLFIAAIVAWTETFPAVTVAEKTSEMRVRAGYFRTKTFNLSQIDCWAYHPRRRQLWLKMKTGKIVKSIVWISERQISVLSEALRDNRVSNDNTILG